MKPEDLDGKAPGPEPDPSPSPEEEFSLSTEGERAAVLASVLRDQAMREGLRSMVRGPDPKPLLPQLAALAIATVMAVYLWFGSPSWLGPTPPPLPPVEVEAATLRLEMFIQAQAIEYYRERNGRMPAFLEEVGPPRPGIRYRRLDPNTYILQGAGDRVRLTYSSRDSLGTFLDRAAESLLTGVEAQ